MYVNIMIVYLLNKELFLNTFEFNTNKQLILNSL